MSEPNSIEIQKLVVHIVDNNLQLPVLSEQVHPPEHEIHEFIEKHLIKAMKDDHLKSASFIEGENHVRQLCEEIAARSEEFAALTSEIAVALFDIMLKHGDIPPADLVFCLFKMDGEVHLGILKFNYKTAFIHYTHTNESGRMNSIIKQKTALPRENQKIEECVFINLNNWRIRLIEKKYEINGEKSFYLSTLFLNCTSQMSNYEKVKIFTKTTEQFKKEYFEEDFNKSGEIKKAITESLDENEKIDITEMAETVFSRNPEIKQDYIEKIEKAGLKDKVLRINEKTAEKKFKKQKIKTDTGIEIDLPIAYYNDKDKIEFINNMDGRISIVIKNVSKITDQ